MARDTQAARSLVRLVVWIFLGEVALVILLGNRSTVGQPPDGVGAGQEPHLTWVAAAPSEEAGSLPGDAAFAEVNGSGFSGLLWGRTRLDTMIRSASGRPFAGFTGSMLNLSFAPDGLGIPSRPVAMLTAGSFETLPIQEPLAGPHPGPGSSAIRMSQPLRALRLAEMPHLPVWTNVDVLAPTSVSLLVEIGRGVLSASVLPPGSGLAAADQEGLKLARSLRFEASNLEVLPGESPLVWGAVEFVWHTASVREPP